MHHLPQRMCVLTYVRSNFQRLVMFPGIDRVVVGGYASGNGVHARWPFAPCCRLQARTPRACCGQFGMREWDLRRIGDGMLQVMHMAWAEPLYWMRVLCSRLYSTASLDGVIFYGVSGLTSRSLLRSQRTSVSRSHVSRRTTSPVVSHHVEWLVCFSLLCSTTEGPLQLCVLVIQLGSLSPNGYVEGWDGG